MARKKKKDELEEVGPQKDPFSSIDGMLSGTLETKAKKITRELVPLEKAPNPIYFIESPDFLDGPQLFPWQFDVARDFFELLCPFCNDVERIKEINDVPREDQILFEHDICPECGLRKYEIADQLVNHNEFIGVLGMRSGKGVLVAALSSAIIHEILCVKNIQQQLGLVKNQSLEAAFAAASGVQASETVYGHFKGFYDSSPWFQALKRSLRDLEISDNKYRRGDLYTESDTKIHFKYKNLIIRSLHSNSASIAGRTRIFAVIDELSRFDSGESKQSAVEVYRVLNNSLLTVRSAISRLREEGTYNIPDARMFCISSPLFSEDMSMQLLRKAKQQERTYAVHKATWEANPEISKEDLVDMFISDPLGAERDFGANPPGAENPLVQDPSLIEVCVEKERPSIFKFTEEYFDLEVKDHVFKYLKILVKNISYKNLVDYVIHCDPGRHRDSFSIAIAHMEDDIFICDGVLEARPIPKGNRHGLEPRQVYFPAMTDIILEANKSMSISAVSYDRWNSLEQIDRLRSSKILAIGKNLDREDHIRFVESMRSGKVKFPKREAENLDPRVNRGLPVAKMLFELKTLNDDGKKVDHPTGGSNDIIQCVIGTHRLLTNFDKVINKNEMLKQQMRSLRPSPFNRQNAKIVRLRRFL